MSALQIRVLAVATWLLVLVLAIPPLALYEAWTPYRDGARVSAEVVEVVARGARFAVRVTYDGDERATIYTREPPGAMLELVVPTNRHAPIEAARLDEQRPSPWLAAMLVACPFVLALGVVLWRAPSRAARRRAARTHPLDAIVDAMRFTRNVSIGLGVFFVASAGFLAVVPLFDDDATPAMVVAIELIALVSVALAVWSFHRALRIADPRRNHVIDLIERRPQALAWFYVQETRAQLGQRGYALHLWNNDGKQLVLDLITEDIDAVLAAIAHHAPRAKQGWSPEVERAYRTNPRSSLDVPPAPDHTTIFVPALALLIASTIAATLLIAKAATGTGKTDVTSTSAQVLDELLAGLAGALGAAGSIAVSAVVVGACVVWFVWAWRRYRAVTRATS